MSKNINIVEQLPNGKFIIKIEKEINNNKEVKKVIKYTISDQNGIINILDLNGNLSGIQFFDNYSVNEFGDIIIGIQKNGKEYYEHILSHFDLSETKVRTTEVLRSNGYGGKIYETDYVYPTKNIDDIVPKTYSYNYGLINKNGVLVVYPQYDKIYFGNEETCIVGNLDDKFNHLYFGYVDLRSGNAITPICFDEARPFYNDRAVIRYERKYGYLDRNKVITNPKNSNEYAKNLSPKYFTASDFNDGYALITNTLPNHFVRSNKIVIDLDGNLVEVRTPQSKVLMRRK